MLARDLRVSMGYCPSLVGSVDETTPFGVVNLQPSLAMYRKTEMYHLASDRRREGRTVKLL